MKISLISAGLNEGLNKHENAKGTASFPPLGILYLAAILRNHGVEVSVLDQPAKGFTVDETVNWVTREDPDILGLSAIASSGKTAAAICEKVKEWNPNIVTVIGNIYATLNSRRVLMKYPSIDIVVRGEGEITVMELASHLEKRQDLSEVRGITFRKEGAIIATPEQPLIENLDSILFPDRELLDSEYHCIIAGAYAAPRKFTSILSSRGCVYRCRFCTCTKFARNRWRARSAKNTLEELNHLVGDGYRQFIFADDSFTTNKKRAIEICQAMRREKMDVDIICAGRVDNCSYELLSEMAKAGCKMMYFGIESANQRILDYYNKQTTPQQSENAVSTARKAGIDVIIGSFILGAPDESMAEIQNTFRFAKKISIDFPQFSILSAYPGMDIWNELAAKGTLNEEEYWEAGVPVPDVCPGAVPFNVIKSMMNDAIYDFIKRPSFIIKELARTFKSTYRCNAILNNMTRIGEIKENLRHIV